LHSPAHLPYLHSTCELLYVLCDIQILTVQGVRPFLTAIVPVHRASMCLACANSLTSIRFPLAHVDSEVNIGFEEFGGAYLSVENTRKPRRLHRRSLLPGLPTSRLLSTIKIDECGQTISTFPLGRRSHARARAVERVRSNTA